MTPTNQHPITPPPELVKQWRNEGYSLHKPVVLTTYVANCAAQWGADQELKACCEQIDEWGWEGWSEKLLITRRSNPPSLKEQALEHLEQLHANAYSIGMGFDPSIIRRALEQLDD